MTKIVRQIDYEDFNIPLEIHREWRSSVRVSLGKKAILLRLPYVLSESQVEKQIDWAQNWVVKQFDKKPKLKLRYKKLLYFDGQELTVGRKSYTLQIQQKKRKTSKAAIEQGQKIAIVLSNELKASEQPEVIGTLLSRVISHDQKPYIESRIDYYNDLYFQKEINKISLKNNQSNWGSCSTMANINLSSRVLFAPEKVIDYVIVHELTHLEHMNHSKKFWKRVAELDKDYKKSEKWLKENEHLCRFA